MTVFISKNLWFFSLWTMLASLPAAADSPDDILIFVNNKTATNSLTTEEVKQIFLKKRSSWPTGGNIVCINAKAGTALRQDFRKKVLAMSPTDERRYWETQKIKGGQKEPPSFSNLVKAVFKVPKSISYGYRKGVSPGVVKIVATITK